MTKILACTSPAKGHLYSIAPVLAELVSRGHDVTALTLPDSDKALSPLGIDTLELPAALAYDALHDWRTRSRIGALRAALRALVARVPDEIEIFRSAIAATRPQALLVDVSTLGAQIYAAATGLPWAAWSPLLLPIPSRDVPPYGPGLRPKPGRLGRIRDRPVGWVLGRMWDEVLPQLNHMRQYYGLATLEHTVDQLGEPPLLLNFTAPPFDDTRGDWPASVRQIGPSLWAPHAQRPEWLDRVDRPLAVVTCSTGFQDDGRLAQVAMDALADSELFTVVTSGAIEPEFFAAPPNARVESFLPHQLLLDRAAVVVSHGGMGITQKALAAGVPVCVVPFGRDQFEVARRVVGNAAGTWLPKKRLHKADLRTAIDEAMTCRAGAAKVAAGFAAAGGTDRGADLLEQHFAGAVRAKRPGTGSIPIYTGPGEHRGMVGGGADGVGEHRRHDAPAITPGDPEPLVDPTVSGADHTEPGR